jgi:hypothetical protein
MKCLNSIINKKAAESGFFIGGSFVLYSHTIHSWLRILMLVLLTQDMEKDTKRMVPFLLKSTF